MWQESRIVFTGVEAVTTIMSRSQVGIWLRETYGMGSMSFVKNRIPPFTWRALLLWLVSMAPLFTVVFLVHYDWQRLEALYVVSGLGLVCSLVASLWFNRLRTGSSSTPVKLMKVEDKSYEHVTFLVSVLLPLMTLGLPQRKTLAFVVLTLGIGVLLIRTETYYANPTLALLGFRLYRVEALAKNDDPLNCFVLSKEVLEPQMEGRFLTISNSVCLFKRLGVPND